MRLSWILLAAVTAAALLTGWEAAAQVPEGTAEPGREASTPTRVLESLRDFGAFGASAGGMLFLADEDASKGARVRPSLQGIFRFRFSDDWVGVGEFGMGWNAYAGKGDTVLTVTSGTMGAYRRVAKLAGLDTRVGAGAGLYRWNYKFSGKSIRDPETQLHLRALVPGVFTGLELEGRLTAHVTLTGTGQLHYLFSSNKDDFPTVLGGSDAFAAARLGVNYHFSPYRGILWERKERRVIRLESGQAGS